MACTLACLDPAVALRILALGVQLLSSFAFFGCVVVSKEIVAIADSGAIVPCLLSLLVRAGMLSAQQLPFDVLLML